VKGVISKKEFKRINPRRCELICKKHRDGLTEEEEVELNHLEEITSKHMQNYYPRDTTELDAQLKRILAELE
jgi:hypothetical protein